MTILAKLADNVDIREAPDFTFRTGDMDHTRLERHDHTISALVEGDGCGRVGGPQVKS